MKSGQRLGLCLFLSFTIAGLAQAQATESATRLARASWTATMKASPGKTPLEVLDSLLFPVDQTISLPAGKMAAIAGFLLFKDATYGSWTHDRYPRTNDIRLTGPYLEADPVLGPLLQQDGAAYMTHSRVRVYYSDGVVQWLKNDRKGEIPDGEMIIKEMFTGNPDPSPANHPDTITGYATMIRQKHASKDGWLWFIWFVNIEPPVPPFAQFGMSFCLSCHASVDNSQITFVDYGNITGEKPSSDTYVINPKASTPTLAAKTAVTSRNTSPHLGAARGTGDAEAIAEAEHGAALTSIPLDLIFNHVVAQPGADGKNKNAFLTSDACVGCHDASYLQNNRIPMMMHAVSNEAIYGKGARPTYFNLSEWSEWNGSLMSQSSRDPVFLAQLEFERALRPAYKDSTSDFCFSCHGAMGQRQFHLDGKPGFFTPDIIQATPPDLPNPALTDKARYGALARDGVSCMVCHRITPEGLGTEASYNAQFKTGPAHEVYGPFDGKAADGQPANPVKTVPMDQGLGITPGFGPVIGQSKLCGSCHTVEPPIIPLTVGKNGPVLSGKEADSRFKRSHEQTTYFEWLNSQYSDEAGVKPTSQSCADCHMPDYFGTEDNKLAFQIANVEDGTFPIVATRDKPDNITLDARSPFRRHTLTGINLFTMQLFQQFSTLLGLFPGDPYITIPPSIFSPVDRITLAQSEAYALSQKSVAVSIAPPVEKDGTLTVKVNVKNLAGHSLPSGVGFRRAWVNLSVLDPGGNVLWASGRANADGVLVDERGLPLKCEESDRWQDLQPDLKEITRQDQVQIYEERDVDESGLLTTSFLSLFKRIKNNRILPAGWSPTGPHADKTRPVKLGGDPVAKPDQIGFDEITYKIPSRAIPFGMSIRAEVFYQALPPYYLNERSRTQGEASQRLTALTTSLKFTSNTSAAPSKIQGWRVSLGKSTQLRPQSQR